MVASSDLSLGPLGQRQLSELGVTLSIPSTGVSTPDDDKMSRRALAARPAPPTTGIEVLRKVDTHGLVSFAGTGYRVGNRYWGQTVGGGIVGDTIQITQDGSLL